MENEWITIFKTGTHTPVGSASKYYSKTDLDQIVDNYDPEIREAPLVFGHPKTNDPAYGLVAIFLYIST